MLPILPKWFVVTWIRSTRTIHIHYSCTSERTCTHTLPMVMICSSSLSSSYSFSNQMKSHTLRSKVVNLFITQSYWMLANRSLTRSLTHSRPIDTRLHQNMYVQTWCLHFAERKSNATRKWHCITATRNGLDKHLASLSECLITYAKLHAKDYTNWL